MSLPPGFLDELRTRTSISQVVGRKVTWDARKSNAGKGDWWAPCPFHQEKSASFHVDDRKGFYYCFGCHAKGDALSFVRETENLGFMEAVELLAAEAGMKMPARDPQAAQKADARKGLAEIMELAVQFYRLQLNTSAATPARDYLARRGLSGATIERFEIGFAPPARGALQAHLSAKGIAAHDLDAAGLCALPDDGGQPYDRFRDRIMFPIRDPRGRAIAFGGRSLDPEARAKYLNSPETPLFDKGRTLFNHGPAREASGKSGALVVAEGYMDVIALTQAGIAHAVAPLGTAITPDQLHLMWRIADEPVIALDGDKAGLRAAMRLVDLALPLLQPGKSLRFCLLPKDLDPDELIRDQGAGAMRKLLEDAQPMVRMLWQKETADRNFDSPERRAALDASLRTALSRIADPGLRGHYEAAIRELRSDLFRPARRSEGTRRAGGGWGRQRPPEGATPGARGSLLAQSAGTDAGGQTEARLRESLILAGCLNHPQVARHLDSALDELPFICTDLDQIRRALLQLLDGPLTEADNQISLRQAMTVRLGFDPVQKVMEIGHVRLTRGIPPDAEFDDALQTVQEAMRRHRTVLGLDAEVREAEQEVRGVADEGLTWRLSQAKAAQEQAIREPLADQTGAPDGEELLRAQLQSLLDRQVWVKKKK